MYFEYLNNLFLIFQYLSRQFDETADMRKRQVQAAEITRPLRAVFFSVSGKHNHLATDHKFLANKGRAAGGAQQDRQSHQWREMGSLNPKF